ncbi:MAG: DNA mismatch repair protein MutH [Lactobacillus sp.]|nr:DNA mismatch repair protein MutH [Lactobacillus sp.]
MTKFNTKAEIHNFAKKIEGIPFGELAKRYNFNLENTKSSVGDLFEAYFGKQKDSASEPDLGIVELKATPYKKLKTGNKYSAKERLVFNIINYDELVKEDFEHSHFLHKNSTIELAFYQYFADKPRREWSFSDVVLYEMNKNKIDFEIIKEDWNIIHDYVDEGRADELSEGLTTYLAACTKGQNKNSTRSQPHSDKPAKQRAFSFKTRYMTTLLRKYVLGDDTSEAIIKDVIEVKNKGLKEIIEDKLTPYIGMTTNKIAQSFNINVNPKQNKQFNSMLIRRMLGLSKKNNLNNILEFEKASIIPKTIQVNKNGKIRESMSFPTFDYRDLAKQNWEDEDGNPEAELNNLFRESTFLFLVFKKDNNGTNIFRGYKFYNFSETEIDGQIKDIWERTVQTIKNGVNLTYTTNKKGKVTVKNNFPSQSLHSIIHVRPHASNASYVQSINSNQLPVPAKWTNYKEVPKNNHAYPQSPTYMTKSCFWINGTYIKSIISDLI